ncbi:non-canonical purine NTP pyrophosphatase [Candidatus Gracilibacteria bacterium]|nr:non-canonical purine NTP pyrophosphatase [Candidatus Gracilibacteria bacterium]
MHSITFITGNQNKANYLAKYLGMEVLHEKIDTDEIQSLDLDEVVEHKVRQAYAIAKKPILVEDTALEFSALGKLPGTFIKFFVQELGQEGLCRLLDGKDRSAIARTKYAYFDGTRLEIFTGELHGTIAEHPGADNGFGWDRIFIPEGYNCVRSELSEEDYKKIYLTIKPTEAVREFLLSI